ncbi:hypothetical protein pdam_00025099 [Pocillopora damicornis]|uniref:SMP-30/Gluconolactonase/LRE-like region domain-containing protein n=1 Tax=Pocillopora damicornis TaxID=46731 RepID=A0A3M6UTD9_POCDA|nr:hypothetical protein pdam_00025099 [Pocillopora damicornis]
MQNRKNVEERIEDLIKTTMPALPASSCVEFVTTSEPDSLSLGFTRFSETDVQGSAVEGLDQNFQAGIEAELLICPKKSEGEIRNTQHTDRVEIHMDPADQINGEKLAKIPFSIPVKVRELNVVGKLDVQGGMLQGLTCIEVNNKGVIAVADINGHCILVFNETGKFVRKIGSYGEKGGELNKPDGVTFINDDEPGNFVKSFGKKGSGDGELKNPKSVCITSDRRFIIVADYNNTRVQVFTMDGEPVFKFGDSGPVRLDHPLSCVCYEKKVFVADKNNNCVKVFDERGQFLYKFREKGNGDGQLNLPFGLCVRSLATSEKEDGNFQAKFVVKVPGTYKMEIKINGEKLARSPFSIPVKVRELNVLGKLDLQGEMLQGPTGIAVNRKGGNNRIQQFTLEGILTGKTSTNIKFRLPTCVTSMLDDQILVTDFKEKEVYILK